MMRRKVTKGDGFLRRSSVTAATAERYKECVRELIQFVKKEARGRLSPANLEKADRALEAYLEQLFSSGESKEAGRYTLFGLAWARGWATRSPAFPLSKQALKGWDRMEPAASREPIPCDIALAFARRLSSGTSEEVEAAAAILLCFDTYLRPSECLGLTRSHVVPPHGQGATGQWAVTIAPAGLGAPSKTSTYDDTVIVGEAKKPRSQTSVVLKALYDTRSVELFPRLTLHRFEVLMRKTCVESASGDAYMPHQCRHGGASHDALDGIRPMRDIQRRGRWRARESLRRYEKHGVLLRVWRRTPLAVLVEAGAAARGTIDLVARRVRASRQRDGLRPTRQASKRLRTSAPC